MDKKSFSSKNELRWERMDIFMIAVLSGVASLLTYLEKILKKKGLHVKFKVRGATMQAIPASSHHQ
jgi:hypothetical protein